MALYSVNSWSFERQLGPLRMVGWNSDKQEHELTVESHPEQMTLVEFIQRLGQSGYEGVELSYAQFQESSPTYLEELRTTADRSGVRLVSLLVDDGDLSAADAHRRALEVSWFRNWIDIAAAAGFERVRLCAGEAESGDQEALGRAAEGLRMLTDYAEPRGVRIVTENLGSLLAAAGSCVRLLELCQGKIGFTADFGNFQEDKYRQLAEVMPHAETVHAKADAGEDGALALDDYRRCVQIAAESGFDGPYTLTVLGEGDTWAQLAELRQATEAGLAARSGAGAR